MNRDSVGGLEVAECEPKLSIAVLFRETERTAVKEGAAYLLYNQLSLFAPATTTDDVRQAAIEKVVARLDERRSRAEEKADLSTEVRKLVNMVHKRTRQTHAQLHLRLNAAQKVRSQTACTEQQLRERILLLREMLAGR